MDEPVKKMLVHCKKEPYDIYIGRGSKYGNPFTHVKYSQLAEVIVDSREEAIECYKNWIEFYPNLIADAKKKN